MKAREKEYVKRTAVAGVELGAAREEDVAAAGAGVVAPGVVHVRRRVLAWSER